MSHVDPETIRVMVRQELEHRLGLKKQAVSEPSYGEPLPVHPSHLDVISECSEPDELSRRKPCLIEPYRFCSNSGYCRKLGF